MEKRKLLKLLINNRNFVTKEEILRKIDISFEKFNKLIDEFNLKGYEISIHPHLGYKLKNIPDILDDVLIKAVLNTKFIGNKIYIFETVASTNDKIATFSCDDKQLTEGTVFLAEKQTKGRGKYGRKWISPKGGLYISILFKPNIEFDKIGVLNIIGAISIAEAINNLYDISVSIKWPNDVFLNNKKLAGVLSEIKMLKDRKRLLIMGMGINVNVSSRDLPPESVSLNSIGFANRIIVLSEILKQVEKQYCLYGKGKFEDIIKYWKKYSNLSGRQVRVVSSSKEIHEGYVKTIDPVNGALILRSDSGLEKSVIEGNIEILI